MLSLHLIVVNVSDKEAHGHVHLHADVDAPWLHGRVLLCDAFESQLAFDREGLASAEGLWVKLAPFEFYVMEVVRPVG